MQFNLACIVCRLVSFVSDASRRRTKTSLDPFRVWKAFAKRLALTSSMAHSALAERELRHLRLIIFELLASSGEWRKMSKHDPTSKHDPNDPVISADPTIKTIVKPGQRSPGRTARCPLQLSPIGPASRK
jgi:hypothetical protein